MLIKIWKKNCLLSVENEAASKNSLLDSLGEKLIVQSQTTEQSIQGNSHNQ
jgi:hypothetical protein